MQPIKLNYRTMFLRNYGHVSKTVELIGTGFITNYSFQLE